MTTNDTIIEVKNLKTQLGGAWIHKDVNLEVKRGEILAIVGGSGSGKTTLLREILMLLKPTAGTIRVFDVEMTTASSSVLLKVQRRWGVLFQQNALFSSLTLLENVAFPLREHTQLDEATIQKLALLKIELAGLPRGAATKFPSELSGGMQKRAGLARAIVLDPELLFLDEPSAGLDPDSAGALDELILDLQATLGLTIIMVTHDLDSLWKVSNRVAFLGEGKVLAVEPMKELVKNPNKLIKAFFNGPRGRVAEQQYEPGAKE
ncbi:MAG: ATP-binding cassette domain-containing protein [Gammaproteobacteria bacterium]|nr:ATP-binding cassette domain-containing protein [Gammaproteobacteria bacterium]